jgi:hypothetical protein
MPIQNKSALSALSQVAKGVRSEMPTSYCFPSPSVRFVVRYVYRGEHFTSGAFDLVDLANDMASHLREAGFQTVTVESVTQ